MLYHLYLHISKTRNLLHGIHVCWSEHSDSSFVYGFIILDYGLGTMTATTIICYKYNKAIRNIILNFNRLISDLDIKTSSPDS